MTDEKIIRDDLTEIKYYFSRKYILDSYMKDYFETRVVNIAELYNNAMKQAPTRLFHLYVCLYLRGNTQECVADEIGITHTTLHALNKELIEWLCKNLNKEESVC